MGSRRWDELFVAIKISSLRDSCGFAQTPSLTVGLLPRFADWFALVSRIVRITVKLENYKFMTFNTYFRASSYAMIAVAMLARAAGAAVKTIRADTCDGQSWKCTADHSLLLARGDTVRYLERPVRSSRDYAGQDPPSIRYLILARDEDRALQTASLACTSKRLAADRLEKRRIENGNRAAVQ